VLQVTGAVLLAQALENRSVEDAAVRREISEKEIQQRKIEMEARERMAMTAIPFEQRTTAYTRDVRALNVHFDLLLTHLGLSDFKADLALIGYTQPRHFMGIPAGRLLSVFHKAGILQAVADSAVADLIRAWWDDMAPAPDDRHN
jgi:hypothetical protein